MWHAHFIVDAIRTVVKLANKIRKFSLLLYHVGTGCQKCIQVYRTETALADMGVQRYLASICSSQPRKAVTTTPFVKMLRNARRAKIAPCWNGVIQPVLRVTCESGGTWKFSETKQVNSIYRLMALNDEQALVAGVEGRTGSFSTLAQFLTGSYSQHPHRFGLDNLLNSSIRSMRSFTHLNLAIEKRNLN